MKITFDDPAFIYNWHRFDNEMIRIYFSNEIESTDLNVKLRETSFREFIIEYLSQIHLEDFYHLLATVNIMRKDGKESDYFKEWMQKAVERINEREEI